MNESKRELLNDRALKLNLDSINKVHTCFDEYYECISHAGCRIQCA